MAPSWGFVFAIVTLLKYTRKALMWFDLCLDPRMGAIRFGEKTRSRENVGQVARIAADLGKPARPALAAGSGPRLDRDAPVIAAAAKSTRNAIWRLRVVPTLTLMMFAFAMERPKAVEPQAAHKALGCLRHKLPVGNAP